MFIRNAAAAAWLLMTFVMTAGVSAQTTEAPPAQPPPSQAPPAQAPPTEVEPPEVRRPFRGLFGMPSMPGGARSLDFNASIFGAYDDDVFADQGQGTVLDPGLRESGWFGGVQGGLVYTQHKRRIDFGGEAGFGVTRYPQQNRTIPTYRAAVNLSARLTRRTSLSVAESFVYAPEFRLGLFASTTTPGGFDDPFVIGTPDLGLYADSSYRTSTNLGLSHVLPDRTTIESYYSLLTASYTSGGYDYFNQAAGVRYVRPITRNASMRLGYGYSVGRYPNGGTLQDRRGVHNIDAGVDYGRALSISRRTHFSFSTGSALYFVTQGTVAGEADRLRYTLIGSANLNHEMGRTWTTSLVFRRSVDFHEGFADPFVAQSLSADLRGLLSRRLSFESSVQYSQGQVGAGVARGFSSSGANAGLQYGLTRSIAAYVNYMYYRYNFDSGVAVDPRFPRALARNGIRVGLTTSIPLIRAR